MNEGTETKSDVSSKYIFAAIFLVLLVAGTGLYALSSRTSENQVLPTPSPLAIINGSSQEETTASPSASPVMNVTELKIEDEVVGTGSAAVSGRKVTVNYVGTLTDGTKFDSSYDHGTPFSFVLGGGQVIPGWDQGVDGMKVGGKRKLIIPSSLAYGDGGVPGRIPGGATLIFEIELLNVE